MRRRDFIAYTCALAARPLWARAQERMARIGYFGPASSDADEALFEAFKAGLAELGYVPGKTIEIEPRFADGSMDQREDRLAAAAHRVTKIVAAVAGDLVAVGLADSLSHPGGNVTGEAMFFPELMVKRVAFLKQVKPTTTKAGLLIPPNYSALPAYLRVLDAPVRALGVELKPIEVAEPNDCDRALAAGASIDGLGVTEVPRFNAGPGPAIIAAAAAHHRLPSAATTSLAKNGGILGYGVDLAPMFRRAAVFVDKILKGAKPGDIPIEQATTFHFVVNLKTAKTLSLAIPPTLLAAADEVIE